jgi:hypothetical protein
MDSICVFRWEEGIFVLRVSHVETRRCEGRVTYLTCCIDDFTVIVDSIVVYAFAFRLFDSGEVTIDVRWWLNVLFS